MRSSAQRRFFFDYRFQRQRLHRLFDPASGLRRAKARSIVLSWRPHAFATGARFVFVKRIAVGSRAFGEHNAAGIRHRHKPFVYGRWMPSGMVPACTVLPPVMIDKFRNWTPRRNDDSPGLSCSSPIFCALTKASAVSPPAFFSWARRK